MEVNYDLWGGGYVIMRITNIKKVILDNPIPVYDVVNATPYNNFLISNKNGGYIVSHNC